MLKNTIIGLLIFTGVFLYFKPAEQLAGETIIEQGVCPEAPVCEKTVCSAQVVCPEKITCPELPILGADITQIIENPTVRILINTSSEMPYIGGEVFPQGEWKHMSDQWVKTNAAELAKYPDIKEAQTILDEKMKAVIEQNDMSSFAQGLKEASIQYNQTLPAVADEILKLVPYEK